MIELFSVNEAAAIAEISPETIRTALEKKSVKPSHKQRAGKAVRHRFSAGDVLLVKILVEFPFPLSKQDKQSLAQILTRGNRRAGFPRNSDSAPACCIVISKGCSRTRNRRGLSRPQRSGPRICSTVLSLR